MQAAERKDVKDGVKMVCTKGHEINQNLQVVRGRLKEKERYNTGCFKLVKDKSLTCKHTSVFMLAF